MLLYGRDLFVIKKEIGSPWSFLSAAQGKFTRGDCRFAPKCFLSLRVVLLSSRQQEQWAVYKVGGREGEESWGWQWFLGKSIEGTGDF